MEDTQSETQLNGYENGLTEKNEAEELRYVEVDNSTSNICSSWFSMLKFKITIEPAICAIFIAINLCDIVITTMIMERTCLEELRLNTSECNLLGNDSDEGHRVEAIVQPYASLIITSKSVLLSILPAVLSLFLGPWSDLNGRKFLLLLPMIGLSMSLLMYAVISYFPHLKPIYFLLASLPFSFSGGFINLISAAYAYVSDISSEENRSFRLGILEMFLFVGLLIGVTSSYRVYKIDAVYGYTIILSIGALISLIAFFYTIFFIPESIQRSEDPQSRKLFKLSFVRETFVASFKRRENHGRTLICLSLVITTVIIVVMEGESNLVYLFSRYRFGWNYPEFMNWCSVSLACYFLGLMVGCVIFLKILKVSDILLVSVSFVLKIIQSIFYGLIPVKSSSWMYWVQLFGAFGGVSGPALRSVMSKLVPKEDIGKIFFLATSFESLFPLVITPVYTALYNMTMNTFPGAFFMFSASLYALNFVLCCVITVLQKRFPGTNYTQIFQEKN